MTRVLIVEDHEETRNLLKMLLEANGYKVTLRALLQQWTARAAPVLAAPLDDIAFHALHESALARTIEVKIDQLEAAHLIPRPRPRHLRATETNVAYRTYRHRKQADTGNLRGSMGVSLTSRFFGAFPAILAA